jgi:hypothetical protein
MIIVYDVATETLFKLFQNDEDGEEYVMVKEFLDGWRESENNIFF